KKQIDQKFNVPERFLAIKYLENDHYFMENFKSRDKKNFKEINYFQNLLKEVHGRLSDVVISSTSLLKFMVLLIFFFSPTL
ncbi:unnamed protein product, partial [marine sediment metagenome]